MHSHGWLRNRLSIGHDVAEQSGRIHAIERACLRLESYPSPESSPGVAAARPAGSVMVDTRILIVDGRPAIAVMPHGEGMNLLGLRADLGAEFVQEGEIGDLPWPYDDADAPVPPRSVACSELPVFIDPSVIGSNDIEFSVLGSTRLHRDPLRRVRASRAATRGGARCRGRAAAAVASLAGLFPVLLGRATGVIFESAVKMRHRCETGAVRDLCRVEGCRS